MLAKILSFGIAGLDAFPVTIEVDAADGLPITTIVGLPDNAIRESKERIRSALKNSGYTYPSGRITVNLAPADVKKEGPAFDLAMALGILAASGQIPLEPLKSFAFLGEMALDGRIRPVNGALAMALAASQKHLDGLLLPTINAPEAAIAGHLAIYPARHLTEVIHFLQDRDAIKPCRINPDTLLQSAKKYHVDFSDVKGQRHVKRGLEIAAAGGHNCLLIGPPGSGKTMLAKRLPTILPDMTLAEALETTKIHSVMGLLPPQKAIIATRPFRAPHHTSSDIALVGGGSIPKPGEVTFSHNGVLFLDELPEFNRNVLEALRQPLEDQTVTVARATKSLRFPAKFMLIVAMNPCPCGWLMDSRKPCHCSAAQIQRYMNKISGPLLDRIDLHLEVPSLKTTELLSPASYENSATIKERTTRARQRQRERFDNTSITANAQMTVQHLREHCRLDEECTALLKAAIDQLGLSARAHDKILKIARTIADMEESETITAGHLAEAIQYRNLDRNWWG